MVPACAKEQMQARTYHKNNCDKLLFRFSEAGLAVKSFFYLFLARSAMCCASAMCITVLYCRVFLLSEGGQTALWVWHGTMEIALWDDYGTMEIALWRFL